MGREIDKILSALILLAFCALWVIRLCLGDSMSESVVNGMSIAMSIMLILNYFVLMFNAWGAFDSKLFKIIFLVISGFLVLCVVAGWVPVIRDFIRLPYIGF